MHMLYYYILHAYGIIYNIMYINMQLVVILDKQSNQHGL